MKYYRHESVLLFSYQDSLCYLVYEKSMQDYSHIKHCFYHLLLFSLGQTWLFLFFLCTCLKQFPIALLMSVNSFCFLPPMNYVGEIDHLISCFSMHSQSKYINYLIFN